MRRGFRAISRYRPKCWVDFSPLRADRVRAETSRPAASFVEFVRWLFPSKFRAPRRHLFRHSMLSLLVAAGALVASPMRLVSPAASPAVAARTPAAPLMGVTVKTTKPGDGKTYPKAGQMVKAHYTGRLLDGTVFDSSRGFLKQPFQFQIGAGDVIRGWDQGMLKMSKGEKATLTCTPDFACTREHIEPSAARRALGPPTCAEITLVVILHGRRPARRAARHPARRDPGVRRRAHWHQRKALLLSQPGKRRGRSPARGAPAHVSCGT